MSNADSSYLLQSGHDSTNESCLRMLFDIYSHWFRTGVDSVPSPLLSQIIKSVCFPIKSSKISFSYLFSVSHLFIKAANL